MEDNPTPASVILYEVFVGIMPDGRQAMVQVFRRKDNNYSMLCQLAFRDHTGQTWSPPVRLDTTHQVTDTETGRPV
jgi:hypothetical protein